MKNLLVIDGNSILNRAFYGVRPLSTKDGLPTGAVYGFITILKKHIDTIKPDLIACAFDMHAPTFRHRAYSLYKANRKGMPEELAVQLPWAKKAAEALGARVIQCEGYEADDIIGTVCALGDKSGEVHSYVLTGDRDSLQLINDTTSVILTKTKEDVLYTPERFTAEYNVTPLEYIDVKALMGDSSDNVPGVRGIGEKTAFKLIEEKGSLEGVYSDIENLTLGKSAKEKLAGGKDDAYNSRFLVTIVKDAPIGLTLDDLKTGGYDKKALRDIFLKLEFPALYRKFGLSDSDAEDAPESGGEFTVPEFREADYSECVKLKDVISVACDGGKYYITDGEKYIFSKLSSDEVKSLLSKKKIVCHDYKSFLEKHPGVDTECVFDTMLAGYLLSPGVGYYPLEKLIFTYLHVTPCDMKLNGATESFGAWSLFAPMSEALKENEMESLLHDIELPLAKVLSEMETVGMMLDAEGLTKYCGELKKARDDLMWSIYESAGHEFNINSPKQLGAVLFDELGLPAIKKTKSGYSTNAEVLSALKGCHVIIEYILMYREVTKLISTYAEVLPHMTDENGRIHTTFNQTGTATGRLSSNDPNLQNIPVRGELGREIRKYFTAKKGHVLIDADYSQIELVVLSEVSGDENMRETFISGKDIHTATASQVFGVSESMVDSELRRRAKAVNFGIVYGIGAYSLSQDLGISRKQADDYIKSYLRTYPKVEEYLENTVKEAKEKGYTMTLFGRRRPIPELSATNKNVRAFGERVAMNSPIQGTAADIIKIAMINVSRALKEARLDARLVMQVHDELIVESSEADAPSAAEILKREMENTVKTSVPFRAEVKTGKNWYEAK